MGNKTFNTGSLSDAITVDPSTLNIGIGGSTSAYKADITGTGRFTGALTSTNFILSGGTGNTGIYYGHTDRVVLANYTAGGIDFEVNSGAVTMTLFPTGNLAVGTSPTDAGYKLDVAGTGRFTGTGYFGGATSASGLTGASELIVQNEIGIQNSDTTGPYLRMVMGSVNQNITFVTGAFSGTEPNLLFNVGGSTRVTVLASNGNVGIATTSPQEKFEIAGLNGNIRLYGRSGISNNTLSANIYYNGTAWVRDNGSFGASYINFGAANDTILFSTTAATTGDATERMRITSGGEVQINNYLYMSKAVDPRIYSGTGIGLNIDGAALYLNRYSASNIAMVPNGGNVLIGTITDSGYKLSVASGSQYFGSGFQISNDFTNSARQCATGVADFAGTSVTFNLASIFPRTTFTNRGLSVTMQLVALPTYTIVSSAFIVLGRTGNSNEWSSSILTNININGASVNSVSASGTTITVNYSTYIFGTAYINLATIG